MLYLNSQLITLWLRNETIWWKKGIWFDDLLKMVSEGNMEDRLFDDGFYLLLPLENDMMAPRFLFSCRIVVENVKSGDRFIKSMARFKDRIDVERFRSAPSATAQWIEHEILSFKRKPSIHMRQMPASQQHN